MLKTLWNLWEVLWTFYTSFNSSVPILTMNSLDTIVTGQKTHFQPISDDFKRVIKEERRGKNLGDNILENKDLQNNSSDNNEETFPDLEDEIDSIEVIEEVIESFPKDSRTIPQNEEERREAELKAKAENQEKKLKNEKID